MLENVLTALVSSEEPEFLDVKHVCLHVHTANEDGISFYKKHGFEIESTQEEYYKDIRPRSAHFLKKDLAALRETAASDAKAATAK